MISYKDIPPLTPERWLENLIEIAAAVSDKEGQENRWLDPDRHAWEHPDELVCEFFDDCQADLFLEQHSELLSEEQRLAAFTFRKAFGAYSDSTAAHEETAKVLADPRWDDIRQKAAVFVAACRRP